MGILSTDKKIFLTMKLNVGLNYNNQVLKYTASQPPTPPPRKKGKRRRLTSLVHSVTYAQGAAPSATCLHD